MSLDGSLISLEGDTILMANMINSDVRKLVYDMDRSTFLKDDLIGLGMDSNLQFKQY